MWCLVSLLAGFAAMSSKEVAVTLPMSILMIEILNSKSEIRNKLKIQNLQIPNITRWVVVVLFFVLALKVPVQILLSTRHTTGGESMMTHLVNQAAAVERPAEMGMTRTNYFLTQTWVVWRYMLMLVVPVGQSIDHDIPLVQSMGDWRLWVGGWGILGFLGAGIWMLA